MASERRRQFLEAFEPQTGADDLRPGRVDHSPRPASHEDTNHPQVERRQHIVIEPVADLCDLTGRNTRFDNNAPEEFGVGFFDTPTCR